MFLLVKTTLTLFLYFLLIQSSYSNELYSPPHFIFYGGVGKSLEDSRSSSDATPWTIGFLAKASQFSGGIGIDISKEGTLLDSRGYRDQEITQALSLNLVVTSKILTNIDTGVLFGIRNKTAECPPSYLGFECYADRPATGDKTFNFGVISAFSLDRLILGFRITTVSQQLIFGVGF